MSKNYTSKDIEVLTDREHVRLRTNIYLGNMSKVTYKIPIFGEDTFVLKEVSFMPAVYKAVNEIIDNCLDEFAQIGITNKTLKIEARPSEGFYSISDNGRGIPIDKHATGKYTPEVALASMKAGRNFSNDKQAGVIGQNGVGSACTNYCSKKFTVDIQRDKKRYHQEFSDGALNATKPSIRSSSSKHTGTSVSFELDDKVFSDIELPQELITNRAHEISLLNPGMVVEYNKDKFNSKKGLEEYVKKISDNNYFKFTFENGEFFVIFKGVEGVDEQVYTWVNSSLLFDSGICNTQFLNAFYDATISHVASQAKKLKIEVTKNDIRENLLVLGNLKIANPEYDAQSKTRLTGPNIRKELVNMLSEQWSQFSRKNKTWFNEVIERAAARHHKSADAAAIKDHQKSLKKKVPGMLDATSDDRFNCQLLITEGLSAKSQISEARDPKTTAAFPLTGKINNVYGVTPAQLLKMDKLTNLLTAIGLVPGKKALRSELRFGKIVIATDADMDGSDIFTLLINLFHTFWPEMFSPDYDPPMVYRLIAPNVVASKGGKRVHFTTRAEYEKQKAKYSNWTIEYMKGLGSMSKKDWEMVLSGETNTMIPIIDDNEFKQTLELLFGPSADKRKEWLQNDEGE